MDTLWDRHKQLPSPNSSQGPLLDSPSKTISLKPEAKEGLIPIIKDLKRQGLLIECSSPYNIATLGVRKGPNKWRLVQDLHLINEAVVPLHPVVPNPFMLLAQYLQVPLTTLPWI
jgi:hypothetical protein